jgi:hypothetical protein
LNIRPEKIGISERAGIFAMKRTAGLIPGVIFLVIIILPVDPALIAPILTK